MNNRKVIENSDIVFIFISELNIFKSHRTWGIMHNKYYSTDEVIAIMNDEDSKVCIIDKNNRVIECNFETETLEEAFK